MEIQNAATTTLRDEIHEAARRWQHEPGTGISPAMHPNVTNYTSLTTYLTICMAPIMLVAYAVGSAIRRKRWGMLQTLLACLGIFMIVTLVFSNIVADNGVNTTLPSQQAVRP